MFIKSLEPTFAITIIINFVKPQGQGINVN